jgi:dTDP-4-dehydrorhamnose 3,5-epimerase
MLFKQTKLKGAYIIDTEPKKDERGFFARSYCRKEFAAAGLKLLIKQSSISYNKKRGTLRGLHYQIDPYRESKLISCPIGAIYDVIIDLRKNSSTYRQWIGLKLSAENHKMLYIPEGFAHGFQTLKDNTIVFYQMSEFYHPESARGLRWDDPALAIKWPIKNSTISLKDKSYIFLDGQIGKTR